MSTSLVVCENKECGKEFLKENKEINRSRNLGRKQYCCLSCYGQSEAYRAFESTDPEVAKRNHENIRKYYRNPRNDLSPFKYFLKCINNKNREKKGSDVDIEYLKNLWENQQGICPFTGWKLILPYGSKGWNNTENRNHRASVDRIDNSKGYTKGNIRIVSVMANYARNTMSDVELIEFCKAVTSYRMTEEMQA